MHPTVNLYYCFTFYSLWIVVAFTVPPSDITQRGRIYHPSKYADSG